MKLSAPIFRLKRQAKVLSRDEGIPLHEAQDRIARAEGFQRWSHLAAQHDAASPAADLLGKLEPGELVLLAGKREHGKTTLAFGLIAEALAAERSVGYFSLDENDVDIEQRLEAAGVTSSERFSSETSDAITASLIVERHRGADAGTLIVIDYLQILDQQRHKPPVADQIETLQRFCAETGAIVVALCQIDRSFDTSGATHPGPEHVRMPNPIDLTRFAKACFIHDGEIRIGAAA